MNPTEQAIHDLAVKALLFEPEIRNDYAEGERELKRHDVLEQALLDILQQLPATEEARKAQQHIFWG